jgi:DNA-binding winged helix-turn-helix (wHTH) protein/TolB-like protein/tetratricopeptide (TPR) repeat protein
MRNINSNKNKGIYKFGSFVLDPNERRLLRDGEPLPLRAKAFDLLLNLVETASTLRSREELVRAVWPDTIVEEHNLTVSMSALRKALGDEDDPPRFIETVRGHGYRFVAEVREVLSEEAENPAPSTTPSVRPRWPSAALSAALAVLIGTGVYAWQHSPSTTKSDAPSIRVTDAAPSIAVLPFEHIGGNAENTFLARGMRQTVLARLARIPGLRVMSSASSEQYPSRPDDLREVAEMIGVSTLLHGDLQTDGEQILINLQLTDAASGRHLWAGSYTRSLSNVIEVENDVATHVAGALQARLMPGDGAAVTRAPTSDADAYVTFLKANYVEDQVTHRLNAAAPELAVEEASSLYRQAIERDADFALAYARLSLLESYAYWANITRTPQTILSARHAATRAIELDTSLPEAWLAKGYVHYYGDRDYNAALSAFERVVEQVPNDMHAKVAIAYVQRRQGDLDKAIEGMRTASLLDPRNPRWPYEVALSLMAKRDYEEADQQFARALAIEPNSFGSFTNRVYALVLAGSTDAAQSMLAEFPGVADPRGQISSLRFELSRLERKPAPARAALSAQGEWLHVINMGGNIPRSLLEGDAYQLEGNIAQAREAFEKARTRLLSELETQPDNADLWAALGITHAHLGDRDKALYAARRATEIVPVSRDMPVGLMYATVLARVYARLGETDMAVKLLRELLQMPNGMFLSVALLRIDPDWDPIRNDPAFQSLLDS